MIRGDSFAFIGESTMKQSILTEGNKKYKRIDLPVKTNTIDSHKELRIVSSIKRISTKPNKANKIFYDSSKDNPKELHEQIALATEEIINLFYDMELAILSEGAIPLIMGEKLCALKAIIFLCKIQLCMPRLNDISFPESFTEEYSRLLKRTDKAIYAMKTRIDKLKFVEDTEPLINVLEKNFSTLIMLRMHYISALELPNTN